MHRYGYLVDAAGETLPALAGERSLDVPSRPRGGVRLQSRAPIDSRAIAYLVFMYVSIHLYDIHDVHILIWIHVKYICIGAVLAQGNVPWQAPFSELRT